VPRLINYGRVHAAGDRRSGAETPVTLVGARRDGLVAACPRLPGSEVVGQQPFARSRDLG
jgi:hypothetical protein